MTQFNATHCSTHDIDFVFAEKRNRTMSINGDYLLLCLWLQKRIHLVLRMIDRMCTIWFSQSIHCPKCVASCWKSHNIVTTINCCAIILSCFTIKLTPPIGFYWVRSLFETDKQIIHSISLAQLCVCIQ